MVLQVFRPELWLMWWLIGNEVIILPNVLTTWLCYFMSQVRSNLGSSSTLDFAPVISLSWHLGPHLNPVTCDLIPTVRSACWLTDTLSKNGIDLIGYRR